MNPRIVVCLVLVSLTFCSSAHAEASASASLDPSLKKSVPVTTDAAASSSMPTTFANPSAPPTEPEVVLSLPKVSMDLDITKQKVPLLTVAEAPCKQLCKDKCDIKLEKTCINVTLPKKECHIATKHITKKFCEKRCKPSLEVQFPSIVLPKLELPKLKLNLSKQAAVAASASTSASLSASAEAQAALSASASSAAGPLSASTSMAASKKIAAGSVEASLALSKDAEQHGDDDSSDRKLMGVGLGLVKAAAVKAAVEKVKETSVKPKLECHDVCVELPIELPELQCSETSYQVEKCTETPEKTCQQECVCIPQKSISLSLSKKPALSVSASVQKVDD